MLTTSASISDKEVEYTPVEYPPGTSEIMSNIRDLERQISQEMDELEKLLADDNL